jgi:hypothetical protein
MLASDARAVAAGWVAGHAAEVPGHLGALLGGSLAWLPDDTELPATSDVDVMVVTDDPGATAGRSKRRQGGVLLEVTVLPWDQLRSPERVLASYHLAGLFRTPATILADPSGRLAALQAAVAGRYARREWVRRRCRDATRRVLDGLAGLDPAAPPPARALTWLFPTGVTTHVLLTAGLRNPTIRLRYLAVRALLDDYGRPELHEELLALLGCAHLGPKRVAGHLAAMTAAFDAAAAVARTPFPFASDISPDARPVAVDGSRTLVERGDHREAVFWIAVTAARCQLVLAAGAPAAAESRHRPGFQALLADLGIATPDDLHRRARAVREVLPRLDRAAEAVMAANPAVRG